MNPFLHYVDYETGETIGKKDHKGFKQLPATLTV